mmetsp:Transcript_128451/g.357582  ORF Transcript_128451/g.357582 Transcript_128451/m.357582 type:complete len:440 (-) Transcript_128451:2156-3475(-)
MFPFFFLVFGIGRIRVQQRGCSLEERRTLNVPLPWFQNLEDEVLHRIRGHEVLPFSFQQLLDLLVVGIDQHPLLVDPEELPELLCELRVLHLRIEVRVHALLRTDQLHVLLHLHDQFLADGLHEGHAHQLLLDGNVRADGGRAHRVLEFLLVRAALNQWPPLGPPLLPLLAHSLPGLGSSLGGLLSVRALKVVGDARGVVVLTVCPEVLVVEYHLNGVVRQPIDEVLVIEELVVRCDGLCQAQGHHLLARLVEVLVPAPALTPHLGLGHAADGGQAGHVIVADAHVLHLILPLQGLLQLLLFEILLLLALLAVLGHSHGLPFFSVLQVPGPLATITALLAFLGAFMLRHLAAVGQVVHLPRARLPEGHPALLLRHDPDMLAGRAPPRGVASTPHALDHVGLLLAAQQHAAEQHRVVLRSALSALQEELGVLPAAHRQQA